MVRGSALFISDKYIKIYIGIPFSLIRIAKIEKAEEVWGGHTLYTVVGV